MAQEVIDGETPSREIIAATKTSVDAVFDLMSEESVRMRTRAYVEMIYLRALKLGDRHGTGSPLGSIKEATLQIEIEAKSARHSHRR